MTMKHIAAVLPSPFREVIEADLVAELAKTIDLDEWLISDALEVLELRGVVAFRPPRPGEPPGRVRLRFTGSLAELADQVLCVVLDEWVWEDSEVVDEGH